MKYDVTMALPVRLMIQKLRGIMGRPARRVAQACTSQRPANIRAPRNPMSFHGVRTTPKMVPMTLLMESVLSVFANQQARLVPAAQPHDAGDVDYSHPHAIEHAVLGSAAGTRPMADGHGNHPRTLAHEQRRHEAMH